MFLIWSYFKDNYRKTCFKRFFMLNYRVSPIIRPTRKIRPSVIFEDDFNVSPTLKISPSSERQKDEWVKHSLWAKTPLQFWKLMTCKTFQRMMIWLFLNKLLLMRFWKKNMLMASKCRSFFVISVYLKSRYFYFVTSFFDISK